MTMDFSRLHTYSPPQCSPENTGYTYSLSSSYSSAALEYERRHNIDPVYDSPRMSRRSLRLHAVSGHYGNDNLLDSSQTHSTTYSTRGLGQKDTRTLRSRRQQQMASTPLTLPRVQHESQSGSASLHSCSASDASLLSSLLEESCVQDRTRVSSFWGLDEVSNLKEHTSTTERTVTQGNGDVASVCKQTPAGNGYICRNCSILSERSDALTATASSSSSSLQLASDAPSIVPSTVYGRDRNQRDGTGVLMSVSCTCVRYASWAVSVVVSLVTLLMRRVLLMLGSEHEGLSLRPVASLSDASLGYGRWAVSAMTSGITSLRQKIWFKIGYGTGSHGADSVCDGEHSSYCRGVNVKGLLKGDRHRIFNGSLCDDCKGKQHLETLAAHKQSSWKSCLSGALWHIVAYTGSTLLHAAQALAAVGLFMLWRLLSVVLFAIVSPGKAMVSMFWWLGTGWYQLVTLMSLLNVFFLTRCLPKLLWLLVPLLLILGLWYWPVFTLLPYLPAVNLTQWQEAVPVGHLLDLPQTLYTSWWQHSKASEDPLPTVQQPSALVTGGLERLAQLEQRLEQLWSSVQADGELQEQQRREVLALYQALGEQLDQRTDRDSLGLWVSGLLDERLSLLKVELQRDVAQGEQTQTEYLDEQKRHRAQLAEMEALLIALAAKTQEVQQKQETLRVTPESESIDGQVLLKEVRRLEVELDRIKEDLQGVMGCKGRCEQLDSLQDTVSTQVRQELQRLFYGSEHTGQAELPAPLLPWLSAQFVSGSDLQGVLTALERSILKNITLLVQQSQQPPCERSVTETVLHTAGAAGMSEEQVKVIVQNALKLYSQDRTGLVDYALESGGGSILSTRCSETYETKTALMSLFGVPLWYFSQSPRVVIQPDVNPGNCWAFKGSQGYLVIRLSLSILPMAFTLEHIPKALSPTGNISSAPRQFTVHGLDDEYQEEGMLLGRYTYQEDGDSLQTFPVMEGNDKTYQIIEMRVLSNWGHPEYTCLYRFRVHGEPRTK